MLPDLLLLARRHGASDLHLEPGRPAALRVHGQLTFHGTPLDAGELRQAAQGLLGDAWTRFLEQRSADLSRVVGGVSCRVNVLQSSRGVGLAIRLLAAAPPTLASLNLHPDLGDLARASHGLVLVCGPTGSGKSSTLAALLDQADRAGPRHIVTLEAPIEYTLRARTGLIRQREVGRHTPSFEQGLIDALREDPDVLLVGELRRPETMRLTLDAAETGHLVLTTLHSSTCAEALQRLVSAFPPDAQSSVRVQLADCLVAVVCQRLVRRPGLDFRVPECEVLRSTGAVRAIVRDGAFHKLGGVLELSAGDGLWTLERYRRWMDGRAKWVSPARRTAPRDEAPVADDLPTLTALAPTGGPVAATGSPPVAIELDDGGGADLEDLIAELERRP